MTRLLPLALMAILAACAATPPEPLRLYQLGATTQAASPARMADSLGIGPLKWPDYLNRRQLLVRQDAFRIDALDNDRWAEPLDTGFERVLRENLARLLNPPRLQAHPWALTDAPALNVPIEVLQFDTSAQGETVLRARWRIALRDRKGEAGERSSDIRVQAKDRSPAASVAAQSEALARLAAEIAAALTANPQPGKL